MGGHLGNGVCGWKIEYERMQREPAGKFCVVPQADLQEAFPERLSQ
jgi:hypothetical protein